MTANDARSLDGIDLLSVVPPAIRAEILKQCRWQRFEAQEQIIDRNDDPDHVYFLVEGRVRVVIYSASGREITFDDLEAGSMFGELSGLDRAPRSANVMALTDATVAVLPTAAFRAVVTENPALALATMVHLVGVLRRANERIMELSTLGANNRVHAEILRLAILGGQPDGTAVIRPIPVHSDIASRVSTTRETVARVLSDLARARLVVRAADHLHVADLNRLERLVEDVRGEW
ncbi:MULTISPECIES: Crp/Fnr family transcriptional regulator [Inquilinus]|uniref:CRP-like cAMP-binding protein n=1 Tax=Inquilinus ginsengisoli TaxID=363840 RepID=A0ABU1JMX3_9PROT|nr:Crp/Fnr family transcriptional regulator [Inquilinus ginsengisoli]MDR6289970.1 CRP-like cAMP-binding protein [Inquilinus ginsengisoli]